MAKGQIRSTKEKKKPKSTEKKHDLPKYMRSSSVVSSAGAQSPTNQKK
jgi:hypothetical protein